MTYRQFEDSLRDGEPVEFYSFSNGSQSWNYTTWHEDIQDNGVLYKPAQLILDAIKQTSDSGHSVITLALPSGTDIAQRYTNRTIEGATTLTIRRGHFGDSERITMPKHVVKGVQSIDDAQVVLEIQTLIATLERDGLNQSYTRHCRHTIYDAGCGASKASFLHSGTVIALSADGVTATINGAGLNGDNYYSGGILDTSTGGTRFITSQIGDVLTLSRAFPASILSLTVSIFPGCNLAFSTCKNKFANHINFGGARFMPPNGHPWDGRSITLNGGIN